jgi:general stress protein 26
MTTEEQRAFLEECAGVRALALATHYADGSIQLVGMYYGFLEGAVAFLTKRKSQKVVNLRRDDRATCMIEAGDSYDELRGLSIVGHMEIVEEPERIWELGIDSFSRRIRPYDESCRAQVERAIYNRVALKLHPDKTVSWDHRKVGPPPWRAEQTTSAS